MTSDDHLLGRIFARIEAVDDCLIWTGLKVNGYGRMSRDDRDVLVHRVVWEIVNDAPIPAGMHIHHVCRNRACVNPAHLALMGAREHKSLHSLGVPKPHRGDFCKNGHEFTPENTRLEKTKAATGKPIRICRACNRDKNRRLRERRRMVTA